MLETAFYKDILSHLSETEVQARRESQTRIWSYIGRFLYGFAMIEYYLNLLLTELLDAGLNMQEDQTEPRDNEKCVSAGLFLTYMLDLRKKIEVTEVILKNQGLNEHSLFKRVHALHDLRNVLAHWPFSEDLYQTGISCDFINGKGETTFRKPGTKAEDNAISYLQLDDYDIEASKISARLEELYESAIPIREASDEVRSAIIEEIIRSSDNVLQFRRDR
jgi:hypothetical protein